jgi:hypothetical protein
VDPRAGLDNVEKRINNCIGVRLRFFVVLFDPYA